MQDDQHDALPDLWQAWRETELARRAAVAVHYDAEEQYGSSSVEATTAGEALARVCADQALAAARIALAAPQTLAGAVAQARWFVCWLAFCDEPEPLLVAVALTRTLEALAGIDHDPLGDELIAGAGGDLVGAIEEQRRQWQAMLNGANDA